MSNMVLRDASASKKIFFSASPIFFPHKTRFWWQAKVQMSQKAAFFLGVLTRQKMVMLARGYCTALLCCNQRQGAHNIYGGQVWWQVGTDFVNSTLSCWKLEPVTASYNRPRPRVVPSDLARPRAHVRDDLPVCGDGAKLCWCHSVGLQFV